MNPSLALALGVKRRSVNPSLALALRATPLVESAFRARVEDFGSPTRLVKPETKASATFSDGLVETDTAITYRGASTVRLTSVNNALSRARFPLAQANLSGFVYLDLYIHTSVVDDLSILQLNLETDAANYYYYRPTATTPADQSLILNTDQTLGWRRIRVFRSEVAGTVGAPSWGNITGVMFQLRSKSGLTSTATLGEITATAPPKALVYQYFDDGFANQYAQALPVMQQYGLLGACGLITNKPDVDPAFMTWVQARELQDAGWVVCSHTHTHPNLTTLTAQGVRDECRLSQDALRANGLSRGARMLIAPFGGWSRAVDAVAKEYYNVCRTNSYGTTKYGVALQPHPRHQRYLSPLNTDTPASIIALIDAAITARGEFALAWHQIVPGVAAGTYEYNVGDFAQVCAHIRTRMDEGVLECPTWYQTMR